MNFVVNPLNFDWMFGALLSKTFRLSNKVSDKVGKKKILEIKTGEKTVSTQFTRLG